nr:MAG TPA: hypothetical protein [Caudoviricetes sp.]
MLGFQTGNRQSQYPFLTCAQKVAAQGHAALMVFMVMAASVFIYHFNTIPVVKHQFACHKANHVFNHAQSHFCQPLPFLMSFPWNNYSIVQGIAEVNWQIAQRISGEFVHFHHANFSYGNLCNLHKIKIRRATCVGAPPRLWHFRQIVQK